jgi:DNA repair exonuclease SbcCD ATPase subunit
MAEKWNGVTRAADIARVLIKFISEEDRRIARTRAYGDVGQYLKKRHGECFHGGSVGDDMVQTDSKGVTVEFDFVDGGDAYELTWNKAAKLICGHIYDDEYDEDEEDDDDDEEEVTDVSPIESPKEYMSENAKYAYTVHAQIVTGAQMVEDGLYTMAVGFKKMRDEKLYKELGYKSFEEYCETETKMKRQSVYRMISVVESIPDGKICHIDVTNLGIAKLSMLTTLTEDQREEIVQSADLESTTVKELKAKIDELTGAVQREKDLKEQWHEQAITEADRSAENAERLNKEIADRDDEITMLMSKLKELENRPIEVQAVNVEDTREYKELHEQRMITRQALLDTCKERNELRDRLRDLEKKMSDPLDGMKIYAVRMSEKQYNNFLKDTKDSNVELFKVLGKAVSI